MEISLSHESKVYRLTVAPRLGDRSDPIEVIRPEPDTRNHPKPDEDNEGGDPKKKTMSKLEKAILEFFEKVSIAGLRDTYLAMFLPEKIMWYTAFIIVSIAMVYSSYGIASRWLNQSAGYDDVEITNERFPFPNISICAPEAIEKEKPQQKVVVPEKVKEFMKNHSLNEKAIIDAIVELSTVNTDKQYAVNASMRYAIGKTMTATYDAMNGGYPEYLKLLYPSCEATLSDCYFNGRPFNCCSVSTFVPFDNAVCYHVVVRFLC